jgi:hypothetical protein
MLLEYGRLFTDETEPGSNDFRGDTYVPLLSLSLLSRRRPLTSPSPLTAPSNRSGTVPSRGCSRGEAVFSSTLILSLHFHDLVIFTSIVC